MRRTRCVVCTAAAALIASALAMRAQSPDASRPAFDAVSIKPSAPAPGAGVSMAFQPGGRYVTRNTVVLNLISSAYRAPGQSALRPEEIDFTRVPRQVITSRFDVEARVLNPPGGWGTDETGQPYLRAMLEQRFKLQAHTETRDLPTYSMVLLRSDGSLGRGLTPAAPVDCDAVNRMRRENPAAVPSAPARGPLCAIGIARGAATGGSVTMAMLANALRGNLGRPVADNTGLRGAFDVELHWTPDGGGPVPADPADPAAIAEWPALITAIQDQLGLKLEEGRRPTQVLVIDHIEMPTPD